MSNSVDFPISSETTTDGERAHAPDFTPRRNIVSVAGWSLMAVLAIGVSLGTAAMVERPSTSPKAMASAKPGQNVSPAGSLDANFEGVDQNLTTAGTLGNSSTVRSSESIRLALSSMQRQINALSARNDRLETQLQALRGGMQQDGMTTGTIVSTGRPNAQNEATDALQTLSAAENLQAGDELSSGLSAMRQEGQRLAGVDLGSGISFDALRARWLEIRDASPEALSGLEARAVLRDGSEGLIAHLIVGPLSGQDGASRLCDSIGKLPGGACRPVPFEGQPL